jgi:hypothetical protein
MCNSARPQTISGPRNTLGCAPLAVVEGYSGGIVREPMKGSRRRPSQRSRCVIVSPVGGGVGLERRKCIGGPWKETSAAVQINVSSSFQLEFDGGGAQGYLRVGGGKTPAGDGLKLEG